MYRTLKSEFWEFRVEVENRKAEGYGAPQHGQGCGFQLQGFKSVGSKCTAYVTAGKGLFFLMIMIFFDFSDIHSLTKFATVSTCLLTPKYWRTRCIRLALRSLALR